MRPNNGGYVFYMGVLMMLLSVMIGEAVLAAPSPSALSPSSMVAASTEQNEVRASLESLMETGSYETTGEALTRRSATVNTSSSLSLAAMLDSELRKLEKYDRLISMRKNVNSMIRICNESVRNKDVRAFLYFKCQQHTKFQIN